MRAGGRDCLWACSSVIYIYIYSWSRNRKTRKILIVIALILMATVLLLGTTVKMI